MTRKILLGTFPIDSGLILISDPCYSMTDSEYEEVICSDTFKNSLHENFAVESEHRIITHNPGCGDGVYAVFRELDNEGNQRIVIQTLDPETDFEYFDERDIDNDGNIAAALITHELTNMMRQIKESESAGRE